jgi:hypothetical protein
MAAKIRASVKEEAKKTSSGGFARGGAMKAKTDVETKEEEDSEERKRGGRTKKREGGKVEGEGAMPRADRRARGGRTSAPFSSARNMSERAGSSSSGHEGE